VRDTIHRTSAVATVAAGQAQAPPADIVVERLIYPIGSVL
jgi:hypothetical protein